VTVHRMTEASWARAQCICPFRTPNDGGLVGAGAMHMDRTKKVGGLLTSPDARRLVTGVRAATHIPKLHFNSVVDLCNLRVTYHARVQNKYHTFFTFGLF
jgi:hypothetical protein